APINCFLHDDFNADGISDVLIGGNFLGVTPFHGRFGANQGIILSDEKIIEGQETGLDFSNKEIRKLRTFLQNGHKIILAAPNNDSLMCYEQIKN
ncbi:MAG: hypothetical protein R3182_08140, partial [Draconibacterium sp.]|nr:hypothetical protein [Draconibacterium sp.]